MITNPFFLSIRRIGDNVSDLIDPDTTPTAVGGYGASEVRIYNRALSAGEVKQLYNAGR